VTLQVKAEIVHLPVNLRKFTESQTGNFHEQLAPPLCSLCQLMLRPNLVYEIRCKGPNQGQRTERSVSLFNKHPYTAYSGDTTDKNTRTIARTTPHQAVTDDKNGEQYESFPGPV
jgi:hypothetical protein